MHFDMSSTKSWPFHYDLSVFTICGKNINIHCSIARQYAWNKKLKHFHYFYSNMNLLHDEISIRLLFGVQFKFCFFCPPRHLQNCHLTSLVTFLPTLRMGGRALLAGYHRYVIKENVLWPFPLNPMQFDFLSWGENVISGWIADHQSIK